MNPLKTVGEVVEAFENWMTQNIQETGELGQLDLSDAVEEVCKRLLSGIEEEIGIYANGPCNRPDCGLGNCSHKIERKRNVFTILNIINQAKR